MQLDRRWIEAHIPHQGSMCLLDDVLSFDGSSISCRATTHRRQDNPLRTAGGLGIACGVEYAAQAMALHGAANMAAARVEHGAADMAAGCMNHGAANMAAGRGNQRSPRGFLAGVRDVCMHVQRLDDIEDDLICEATLTAGDATTALYEFTIRAGARTLLTGRATVVFDAEARGPA